MTIYSSLRVTGTVVQSVSRTHLRDPGPADFQVRRAGPGPGPAAAGELPSVSRSPSQVVTVPGTVAGPATVTLAQ
jgi:hypothetical protein